jgi:iron complex outermembrane recepter protein
VQLLALPAGAPPGTFPTIINAAKATVKGIDMEIAARPVAGLAIDLNLLFLDARFDDFVVIDPNNPGDNPDRSNQRMPQAPEWTMFIGMQYSWPVWHYGLLTARGEYRYQSAVFFNAFQDPFVKQDGYGLVNARLQFDSADGHWYVALFGHNLTDELYAQNIIRQEPLTGALRFWGAPRTYGGQVGYRF